MDLNAEILSIKNSIKEGIEIERAKSNVKYDEDSKRVDEIDNVPKLIFELPRIHGNNVAQSLKLIEILKVYLKSDFFKEAETVRGANYVYFSKDGFTVMFPTFSSKAIEIRSDKKLRRPNHVDKRGRVSDWMIKLRSMWIEYEETSEGYSEIVDLFSEKNYESEFYKAYFKFKMKLKKNSEDNFLKGEIVAIAKEIDDAERKYLNYLRKLSEYEEDLKKARDFMKEILVDMENFEENGWRIFKEKGWEINEK